MGTPTLTNLLTGGATLWFAPVAEAFPDETSIDAGEAWGGNWARVGYTSAPLTCLYEATMFDVEVEEHLTPVKRRRTGEQLTIETKLAELTPTYMALAGGFASTAVTTTAAGAGQAAYTNLNVGGVASVQAYAFGFEGTYIDATGNAFPARVLVPKATAMIGGPLEFSNREDNYAGLSVQIKALADTSKAVGAQLFTFYLVTAAATS